MITVTGLYIYPVKSCRGLTLERADVADRGFAHDREWLVVDATGRFMTQRDWPALARVTASLRPDGLTLEARGMPQFEVPTPPPPMVLRQVTIWKDSCIAGFAGSEAASWFSQLLETSCELVWMPPEESRQVELDYAQPGDRLGFADGFPFLLISQASLDALNRRLARPVPMDRFRPNIVVDGCEPHAEDGWSTITIRGIIFSVVKPCARCVITTADQRTGQRSPEPLRTLASYRTSNGKVLFGQNLVHSGRGEIQLGDVCLIEPPSRHPN